MREEKRRKRRGSPTMSAVAPFLFVAFASAPPLRSPSTTCSAAVGEMTVISMAPSLFKNTPTCTEDGGGCSRMTVAPSANLQRGGRHGSTRCGGGC